ncbi:MAG: hypothetical protein ACFUZC_06945 [Chthoniobacteraceae bacterium]
MIYPTLSLQTVGLVVGVLLLLAHLGALFFAPVCQRLLRRFPRSGEAGAVLLTVATVWAVSLLATMDLGEFSSYRQIFMGVVIAGYVLTLVFVREFLAVRALGMLLLLAAEPLIEAAFLRPETSRLLLTVLAYIWATVGMFWVGKPYLLRDQIEWLGRSVWRWRVAALGGALYGAVLTIAAVTLYHG